MGLIEWPDGLIKRGRRELRQVPEKYVGAVGCTAVAMDIWLVGSTTVADGTWTFGEPIELALEFKSGKMGLHLQVAGSLRWRPSYAWRGDAEGPSQTAKCCGWANGGRRRRQHLRWDGGGEDDAEDQTPLEGETWSALQYRCGIVPCGVGYAISNKGRLRNPEGRVTKGFLYAGSRWASATVDGLLVNLTGRSRVAGRASRRHRLASSWRTTASCRAATRSSCWVRPTPS